MPSSPPLAPPQPPTPAPLPADDAPSGHRPRIVPVLAGVVLGILLGGGPMVAVQQSTSAELRRSESALASTETDERAVRQELRTAEADLAVAGDEIQRLQDELVVSEAALSQAQGENAAIAGQASNQIDACGDVGVEMEDAINERISQANDLSTAIDFALDRSSPSAFGSMLDSAGRHADASNGHYDRAVELFDDCLGD